MGGDIRLKVNTRRAYGKKRKRAWNKGTASRAPSLPSISLPESEDSLPRSLPELPEEEQPSVSATIVDRIDTAYLTESEEAQIAENARLAKDGLASTSATRRKFSLLGVCHETDAVSCGSQFVIVDIASLNELMCSVLCGSCGASGSLIFDMSDRSYGLATKIGMKCTSCGTERKTWTSRRTKGEGTITPFEVNVRAIKAIQSIGKGVTALNDFCATMNLTHQALHHKTFQHHLTRTKDACMAAALQSEQRSVEIIKKLYEEFDSPPGNIDVIYDGTWMTRGRRSHIGVGCIVELYTGLVIDHVVLSNFCLGCVVGPGEDDETYAVWKEQHRCQKNTECNSGRMEVEAALTMFGRSIEKHGLRYTTMLSDGDSRTFNALQEEAVYGFMNIEKKTVSTTFTSGWGQHFETSSTSARPKERASAAGEC